MAQAIRWHQAAPVGAYVHRHLRGMATNSPDAAQRRVARGLLDDLKAAGVVVDFSGTNLTQFSVRLGFEKEDEYFFIGDKEWGVSVGYDVEDTASIVIPFSGSVKMQVGSGAQLLH